MSHSPALDTLRRELVRKRLPLHYIRRVMREMTDHRDDLIGDQTTIATANREEGEIQLGDPVDLADTIAKEYIVELILPVVTRCSVLGLHLCR